MTTFSYLLGSRPSIWCWCSLVEINIPVGEYSISLAVGVSYLDLCLGLVPVAVPVALYDRACIASDFGSGSGITRIVLIDNPCTGLCEWIAGSSKTSPSSSFSWFPIDILSLGAGGYSYLSGLIVFLQSVLVLIFPS